MGPRPQTSRRQSPAVWVGGFTAAALALRLYGLDRESLWFDEVLNLWRASAGGLSGILARTSLDVQAPLYDVLLAAVVRLTGSDQAWVLRLISALAGTALVPVTYRLARAIADSLRWEEPRAIGAGITAAGFATFSPFLVRYAQEARPYALLALLSALVLLGTVRAVSTGGARGLRLIALASPLLVMTHYYGVMLLAGVALFMLLDGNAFGPRLPRAVGALLPAFFVLLLWAPVLMRQYTTRPLGDTYRPLDAPALLEVLDETGPQAALALDPGQVRKHLGSLAAARAPMLWLGRLLTLLLVAAAGGTAAARKPRDGPGSSRAAGPPGPPEPPGSCRVPALVLLGVAVLLAACALLMPQGALEGLASRALKGGRALDAENLAFVGRVRTLWLVSAALTAGLAAFVAALPRLVRRAGRGLAPGRLLILAVVVPLAGMLALELAGKRTFAARNLIVFAPATQVLAGLGLFALQGWWRRSALILLGITATFTMLVLPAYTAKADWRAAGKAIAASGAEPVCYPPWLARCVEHYTGRPWNTVFGSWSADEIERFARERGRVILVQAQEAESTARDAAVVQTQLVHRLGEPQELRFRGITCWLFGGEAPAR